MSLSRKRTNERGAAAVEFALVAPLLFLLVFGMIDFGWAINRYTVLNNATREGVRLASLGADSSEVDTSVRNALNGTGIDSTTVTVVVQCRKPDETSCGTDQASGDTAVVTVSYSTDWLTPVGSAFSESLNISKTSRMRIE